MLEAKRLSSPNMKAVEVTPLNSGILLNDTQLIIVFPRDVFGSPDFLPY